MSEFFGSYSNTGRARRDGAMGAGGVRKEVRDCELVQGEADEAREGDGDGAKAINAQSVFLQVHQTGFNLIALSDIYSLNPCNEKYSTKSRHSHWTTAICHLHSTTPRCFRLWMTMRAEGSKPGTINC